MVRSNADVRWLVLLCAFPARANRTAVCLAGTPRTFTRPHVFRSISENLLLALNRTGAVDLFVVLSLQDAPPKNQSGFSFTRVDAPAADVAAALAQLAPRALDVAPRADAETLELGALWRDPRCRFRGFMGASLENLARSLAQPAKWSACYAMLARAEAEDGARYEWVVRTRPDAYWFGAHPPLRALDRARATVYHLHVDWHFVLPRALAEPVMVGMLQRFRACANGTLTKSKVRKLRKHESLESWMKETMHDAAGAPAARVHFPLVVVRKSQHEESARTFCIEAAGDRVNITYEACMRGAYPEEPVNSSSPCQGVLNSRDMPLRYVCSKWTNGSRRR